MSPPKVIIDTDPGLDDALAIFMALAAHKRKEIEILAITTVQGNTAVQNVNNNVLQILKTSNFLGQIPVYVGASSALLHPVINDEKFHGSDGFGDAVLPSPPAASNLEEEHAVWSMINISKKYSGKVTLAALGPLTNIALATRLCPSFLSHFADVFIMGGNTTAQGNWTVAGEFNFAYDPESARIVLDEAQKPIHLTPWELCLNDTKLPYSLREEMGRTKTAVAELMNTIEAKVNAKRSFSGWVTCDQVAMAWMIDTLRKPRTDSSSSSGSKEESFAVTTKKCFATIETQGSLTRGQMVIDHISILKRSPNLDLLTAVNMEVYKRYLWGAFSEKF